MTCNTAVVGHRILWMVIGMVFTALIGLEICSYYLIFSDVA